MNTQNRTRQEVTHDENRSHHPHSPEQGVGSSVGQREDATTLNKESAATPASEPDATVELMKKAFRAGATRIVFIYGPQPEPSKRPIEAVIYVDNYAEHLVDTAAS